MTVFPAATWWHGQERLQRLLDISFLLAMWILGIKLWSSGRCQVYSLRHLTPTPAAASFSMAVPSTAPRAMALNFPFCRLLFCSFDSVLCFTEAFQFQEVPFTVDLSGRAIGVLFRESCPVPVHSRLFPAVSPIRSVYLVLCWGLWSSWAWIFCTGRCTFLYMQTSC